MTYRGQPEEDRIWYQPTQAEAKEELEAVFHTISDLADSEYALAVIRLSDPSDVYNPVVTVEELDIVDHEAWMKAGRDWQGVVEVGLVTNRSGWYSGFVRGKYADVMEFLRDEEVYGNEFQLGRGDGSVHRP